MPNKTKIQKLKVIALAESTTKDGKPYFKCYTNDGLFFCFSQSAMKKIREKQGEWCEYVTRESNGFKNIQGFKPAETREEARSKLLEKELQNFNIEEYLQKQPNHTWLDWEREEQVITDLEELQENEIDSEGKESTKVT